MGPSETRAALAHVVRNYRLTRGWTLADMEKETGVSAATLCRIELGRNAPRRSTLRRLSKAIDRDLSRFLEVETIAPAEGVAARLDADERRLARLIFSLHNFVPQSEMELWMVQPYQCHADSRVRRAALTPLYRAIEAGFDLEAAVPVFLATAESDPSGDVAQGSETIRRALGPTDERDSCEEPEGKGFVLLRDPLDARVLSDYLVAVKCRPIMVNSAEEAADLCREEKDLRVGLVGRPTAYDPEEDVAELLAADLGPLAECAEHGIPWIQWSGGLLPEELQRTIRESGGHVVRDAPGVMECLGTLVESATDS